jgi:hypothetical protein
MGDHIAALDRDDRTAGILPELAVIDTHSNERRIIGYPDFVGVERQDILQAAGLILQLNDQMLDTRLDVLLLPNQLVDFVADFAKPGHGLVPLDIRQGLLAGYDEDAAAGSGPHDIDIFKQLNGASDGLRRDMVQTGQARTARDLLAFGQFPDAILAARSKEIWA